VSYACFEVGNSLAIRLPAAVVEGLELKEGDEIEITLTDRRRFHISRKASRADLLKRLRALLTECDTLFTEDLQDGLLVSGRLRVVNPF
jgi:antitoxin component of MazEF toxin-antitoxin module